MNRWLTTLALVAPALCVGIEHDARACGGCFHPPTQVASDITDERMLLSVSPTQTSLYDQLRYAGSPSSFAWVLPIHGTVDVALSADVLFDAVDALTATEIVAPALDCPPPPPDCAQPPALNGGSGSGSSSGGGGTDGAGGVTVTKSENVGPYAAVQLHSTDPTALNNWLSQNGYDVPSDVTPVIDAYLNEGFDFLAMKLLPNAGVQAMRPVRITMPGASLSLPLRMAAVGTGASVGITIWVVSDGRYEPQNFPFFHIDDSELVWDWSVESSNYTTLRAANEAALGGKGWEIESSIDLAMLTIQNTVLSGGVIYPGGYAGPPSEASQDYLAVGGDDGGAGDGGETADQVREADITALVAGMPGPNVRITRIRSDITHAAMTTDFLLQAAADQSELSNVRSVTKQINEQCPIYSNCEVVGTGTPGQAAVGDDPSSSVGGSNAPRTATGCVASARDPKGAGVQIATLAGLLGLAAARVVRRRRRARK